MRTLIKYLLLISLTLFFSCEEQGWPVKCGDCFTDEPSDVTLIINFEPYKDMLAPPLITIYEGNIEENIVIASFSQWSGTSTYKVKLNKRYSITATYQFHSGKTIIAADSGIPKVRYEKDSCKEPCYFVYDRTYNLRIKYK